jgi:hypothetical protein
MSVPLLLSDAACATRPSLRTLVLGVRSVGRLEVQLHRLAVAGGHIKASQRDELTCRVRRGCPPDIRRPVGLSRRVGMRGSGGALELPRTSRHRGRSFRPLWLRSAASPCGR